MSDAMVPLAAGAGFRWMATDEMILGRTLGVDFTRDGRGHVEQPERLYTPYRIRVAGAEVSCVFRDHVLSDLIGFTYSGWDARERGRRLRRQDGGGGSPVSGSNRRGRGRDPDHPGRRECLGALRWWRPAFPSRALPSPVPPPGASDRDHGGGVPEGRARAAGHLSRGRGSTPTSTSGSVTPTTRPRGASSAMRGLRSMPRAPTPNRRPRRARRFSLPKAATGSGGTATIIPPLTTRRSTTCSGGISGMPTSASSCRRPESSTSATSRPADWLRLRPSRPGCCRR